MRPPPCLRNLLVQLIDGANRDRLKKKKKMKKKDRRYKQTSHRLQLSLGDDRVEALKGDNLRKSGG